MATLLQLWNSGKTAQITAPVVTGDIDGGTSYGPVEYWLYNDLGGASGDTTTARNVRLQPAVFDGAERVLGGLPFVDQRWMQIAVVDMDNAGDSTMESQSSDFVAIGAGYPLVLRDIPKNCGRKLNVRVVVPAGADTGSSSVFLLPWVDDSSVSGPFRLGAITGSGVIPSYRDGSARMLLRGRGLTAEGSDVVTAVKGSFAYDGAQTNVLATLKTLNQNGTDGALAAGQSYKARFSQKSDGTVTVTKSTKGAAPVTPNVPAGEINLGVATVGYQAGGTSVINTNNLDMSGVAYGDYLVRAGTGAVVRIAGGQGLSGIDTATINGSASTLNVTDDATSYVWRLWDGTFAATATRVAPDGGAALLAQVVVAGGVITSIKDLRTSIDAAISELPVTLRHAGAFNTTLDDFDFEEAPFDFMISRVRLAIGKTGTSTSGSFRADVLLRNEGADLGGAGMTIYTSSGTDDQRPAIAHDSTDLHAESVDHEVIYGICGQRISASLVAVPGAITVDPRDVRVTVYLRKR
jgi:hypothetical protein